MANITELSDDKKIDQNLLIMADRLVLLREEINKQQKVVAQELGLKPQVLAYYEKAKRHPNFETLCNIATYYNVSIDYLLGKNDYRNHSDKTFNNLVTEKTLISNESLSSVLILLDRIFYLINISTIYTLGENIYSYPVPNVIINELTRCMSVLVKYVFLALEGVELKHQLTKTRMLGDEHLVMLIEKKIKDITEKEDYDLMNFSKLLHSYISELKDQLEGLLDTKYIPCGYK